MTREQINILIDFLTRKNENLSLENRSVKSELMESEAARKEAEAANEVSKAESAHKDKVIRDKNKQLEKKDKQLEKRDKKLSDLEEQLSEYRQLLYASKQQSAPTKTDKKKDKGENDDDQSKKGNSSGSAYMGGADRQQGEDECDGKTPQEPVTEDKSSEGRLTSATGCTFNPENRPSEYNTMEMSGLTDLEILGKTETRHLFDRSQLPEGSVIKSSREVKFYSVKTILICHTIEKLRVKLPGENKFRWMYIPKPGEEQYAPVEGTKASAEFMQAIAYDYFVKRVTFGNIRRSLRDLGMQISKNTLRNWLKKGKKYLDVLVSKLKDAALEKDCILNCDETWCKVRRMNKYTKKYMWVLVNKAQRMVIFFYDEGSRGRKVLTDFLDDAEILGIMTDGYNAYHFLDGQLKTDHLICMAHARAKFIKAYKQGKDMTAKLFLDLIDELYRMERYYRDKGFSPGQIYEGRQSPETEVIVRKLRSLLSCELSKYAPYRSYYMTQALNYFDHFKDGLFLYRTNGEYPIDNNLAERQVRPFAAQRKCIQHFGSDAGAEMAATYHSIVSTVLLKGISVWRFFGEFFEDIVTGDKRHLALLNLAIE